MKFTNNSITFEKYPFACSIARRQEVIYKEEIRTIDLKAYTPTIQVGEELLFVQRLFVGELQKFAEQNSIPIVNRFDYWHYLLKPYLDCARTQREYDKIDKVLTNMGFPAFKIKKIREEIKMQVIRYNADTLVFEDEYLGFMDVLFAMYQIYDEKQFEDFYWRSMKVAFFHKLA